MATDVPTSPRPWDEIARQLLAEANTRKMAELMKELLKTSEKEVEAKTSLGPIFWY